MLQTHISAASSGTTLRLSSSGSGLLVYGQLYTSKPASTGRNPGDRAGVEGTASSNVDQVKLACILLSVVAW